MKYLRLFRLFRGDSSGMDTPCFIGNIFVFYTVMVWKRTQVPRDGDDSENVAEKVNSWI